jgi:hypothetical protein
LAGPLTVLDAVLGDMEHTASDQRRRFRNCALGCLARRRRRAGRLPPIRRVHCRNNSWLQPMHGGVHFARIGALRSAAPRGCRGRRECRAADCATSCRYREPATAQVRHSQPRVGRRRAGHLVLVRDRHSDDCPLTVAVLLKVLREGLQAL